MTTADHPTEVHADPHPHRHPKKAAKPGVNLNVTSMVDILFNLLVYFIVTASFVVDEGSLKAKLPPISSGKQSFEPSGGNDFPIEIQSTRDGYGCTLFFKGRTVQSFDALHAALAANNHEMNPVTGHLNPRLDTLVIQPGKQVRWQHVVNTFNQATRAGYGKVAFGEGT